MKVVGLTRLAKMRLSSVISFLLICHIGLSASLYPGAVLGVSTVHAYSAPSPATPRPELAPPNFLLNPVTGEAYLKATIDIGAAISSQEPFGPVTLLPRLAPQNVSAVASPSSASLPGPRSSSAFTGSSSSVNSSLGFEGLNQVQSCNCVPPDVQVAAGPNHVVEMVNLETEIFSKQGSSVKMVSLSTFFNTGVDIISDPKVLFDISAGRWFASILDIDAFSVVLAVSTTNDPTGTWNIYRLVAAGCPDQPIIGLSDDKLVASANVFTSCSRGGKFAGAEYWVVNKSEMVAGAATLDFASFGPNGSLFSVHPVQSLSSTATEYMVSTGAGKVSTVQLFSITGVPPSTVTVSTTALSISTISLPPGGVQPGTNVLVNTDDGRVEDAVWFQGKIWFALNDGCKPSGDTLTRSCVRLTQIDTSSSTVAQDFDFGASVQYYFYPALRVDGSGDLDLIYGYSSSTIFPSLAITGQGSSGPLGSLAQPKTLRLGSADETTGRYGDYFGAAVDPSDPSHVWVAGEYVSTTGGVWSTFIASIIVTSADFTISASPQLQVFSPGSSGKFNITLRSVNGFTGSAALGATVSPTVTNGPTAVLSPTLVSLTAGGSGNSTLTVSAANATPPGSYSVTVTGTAGSLSHSITVNVQIFDFSISNSGGITVDQGSSGSTTITVTLLGGPALSVNLSCTGGLPSGTSCSFNPASGLPTFTGSLTINTSTTTASGSYTITVSASGGGQTHTTQFTLTVNSLIMGGVGVGRSFVT